MHVWWITACTCCGHVAGIVADGCCGRQGKAVVGRLEGADTSTLASLVNRLKEGGPVALVPPQGGASTAAAAAPSSAEALNDRLRGLVRYVATALPLSFAVV